MFGPVEETAGWLQCPACKNSVELTSHYKQYILYFGLSPINRGVIICKLLVNRELQSTNTATAHKHEKVTAKST